MSYGEMFRLLPGEVVEGVDQQDQRERLTFPLAHKGHDLGRSLPISFFWTMLVLSHGADVVMSIQQSPSLPRGAVLRNYLFSSKPQDKSSLRLPGHWLLEPALSMGDSSSPLHSQGNSGP